MIGIRGKDFRELDTEEFRKQFFQFRDIVITIFFDKHSDSDRNVGVNPISKVCLNLPRCSRDGLGRVGVENGDTELDRQSADELILVRRCGRRASPPFGRDRNLLKIFGNELSMSNLIKNPSRILPRLGLAARPFDASPGLGCAVRQRLPHPADPRH